MGWSVEPKGKPVLVADSLGKESCWLPACAGTLWVGGFRMDSIGVTPAMGSLVKMPSFRDKAPASLPSR